MNETSAADNWQRLLQQRPGSVTELVEAMTPAIYDSLALAIELGKWPDGQCLSPQQLEYALQAMILYESRFVPEAERKLSNLPTGCGAAAGVRVFNAGES